ncbi:MAG: 4Fe-4S binding protein [Desulfocapsaceae bacterium]|nr:4Fe-4S binding protein [Desulfocapsaceae bacterium]
MKEIVILSGKGGTGKTSLVGSLAYLAKNKILVDCDVDAADLHLLLDPKPRSSHEFRSGVKAKVISDQCSGCGICVDLCQFEAITMDLVGRTALMNPLSCEGCGVCAHFCPEQAIVLEENYCGDWFISDTDYGPLVHAQLFAGEENSGKLVSFIKRQARELAEQTGGDLILIDGAPGIGCPVIASLSGVDMVLAVTEPSQSGWHDLERVLDLAIHFRLQSFVCINKWDLHPEMAASIEIACVERGIKVLGRIPFDPTVIQCQIQGTPVVCNEQSPAAVAIRKIWLALCARQISLCK